MRFLLMILLLALIQYGFSAEQSTFNNIDKHPVFKPTASSCVDYLKSGYKKNGYYTIVDDTNKKQYVVFCDFESEPGMAWTLAMSHSLDNSKKLSQFRSVILSKDAPVNDYHPNWYAYRMSKIQMSGLGKASTHFRYTCSEYGAFSGTNNYNDYLRAQTASVNPLTFTGYGPCGLVEYINIRGTPCAYCKVAFYQRDGAWIFHHDSSLGTGSGGCSFNAVAGSIGSEDDFGYYGTPNPKFTCSKNPTSTTQLWFGARY